MIACVTWVNGYIGALIGFIKGLESAGNCRMIRCYKRPATSVMMKSWLVKLLAAVDLELLFLVLSESGRSVQMFHLHGKAAGCPPVSTLLQALLLHVHKGELN